MSFLVLLSNFFMRVIVIIPAFNEGRQIGKTIADLSPVVKKENILVVDDGSSDNTCEQAKQNGVHVIRHIVNRGAGAATKTGMDYALNQLNADVVVTFDADGQHYPEDIPQLIKPVAEEGVDVVIGSRFISWDHIAVPRSRRAGNYLANLFTFVFSGVWSTDSQSGFKAFSRQALEKIQIKSNTFEFCSEIFLEIKKHNLKFKEVPIKIKYSQYSLSKGQNSLKQGLKTLIKFIAAKYLE